MCKFFTHFIVLKQTYFQKNEILKQFFLLISSRASEQKNLNSTL